MASIGAVGCFALNAASYLPFIWVALWILPRGRETRQLPRIDLTATIHLPVCETLLANPTCARHLVLLTSMLCGPLIAFALPLRLFSTAARLSLPGPGRPLATLDSSVLTANDETN